MRKIRQSLPPCCGQRGATKFLLLKGSGRDKSCSATARKVSGTKWVWSSTEMSTDPLSGPEMGEGWLRPKQFLLWASGQQKQGKEEKPQKCNSIPQTGIHLTLFCRILIEKDTHTHTHTHTHTDFVSLLVWEKLAEAGFSSVQSLSRVRLFVTPWTTARQASLCITNSQSLPKPMSIQLVMPSNHLIICHPLLLLPSIFPSIRVFSNESVLCIRWPKDWSFSFNISPNEHPGVISFRMDWLDLLAVQGTLKSLLQHHSSKASILWCSAFFIVQLSHPYMTTGKTIALTRWTFVGKVMSLLFNMLSRLVITFLPRSKHLLISWLQSPFAVILEPQK